MTNSQQQPHFAFGAAARISARHRSRLGVRPRGCGGSVYGREFSNGVLRTGGKVVALPVTEIIPETEFFDFAAKYEGKSEEVTPANISPELTRQCQERSRLLYEALNCRGVVRFDYILVGDTFFFLEANTIPGISPASIVPQQARAHGWGLGEFFALLIEEALKT